MSLDALDGVIRTGVAGDLEVGGLLERNRIVGSRESRRGSKGLDVDVVVGAVHRDVGDRASLNRVVGAVDDDLRDASGDRQVLVGLVEGDGCGGVRSTSRRRGRSRGGRGTAEPAGAEEAGAEEEDSAGGGVVLSAAGQGQGCHGHGGSGGEEGLDRHGVSLSLDRVTPWSGY